MPTSSLKLTSVTRISAVSPKLRWLNVYYYTYLVHAFIDILGIIALEESCFCASQHLERNKVGP